MRSERVMRTFYSLESDNKPEWLVSCNELVATNWRDLPKAGITALGKQTLRNVELTGRYAALSRSVQLSAVLKLTG